MDIIVINCNIIVKTYKLRFYTTSNVRDMRKVLSAWLKCVCIKSRKLMQYRSFKTKISIENKVFLKCIITKVNWNQCLIFTWLESHKNSVCIHRIVVVISLGIGKTWAKNTHDNKVNLPMITVLPSIVRFLCRRIIKTFFNIDYILFEFFSNSFLIFLLHTHTNTQK